MLKSVQSEGVCRNTRVNDVACELNYLWKGFLQLFILVCPKSHKI